MYEPQVRSYSDGKKEGLQWGADYASIIPMESASNTSCYQKALELLARRDHSCAELRKKLQSRGFGQPQIEAATGECIRFNYLNDARFAESYLMQLQRKGYGINALKHKLYTKGIAKAVIRDSVAPYSTDKVQLDLCRHALEKKVKRLTVNKPLENRYPKLQRFLFGRGFSSHIIRQAIDEIITCKD